MMEENGLPKGWVETTLGEIALINPRESLKKGTAAVNVPMTSLEPFTKKIKSFEIKEFNGGTKFRNGDTLLARITPCLENGKTAFVDILKENEVGFGSTEYIVIRSKRKCSDKNFLYYLSISPLFREVAKKVMTGTSGRQRVQTDVLINRKFNIPPLPEQKAIASILTSFDDKIELLQAQNETLETIAQTIFKEWFGKYQVGDELPEGWRVGKLGEIANLRSGYAFKSKDFVEESNYTALKIKDLKGNGEVSISDISCVDKDTTFIERVKYFKLSEGDIVLAMSGNTTGKIGVVPPHETNIYLNQRVGKFFLDDGKMNSYLYNFLMSNDYENKILSMGYGSAQPNINPTQIEEIDMIFPDKKQLNEYLNVSNTIFDKVLRNNSQIQTLTQTRDTLLPKLMSGQLRVAEFKEQLSEVM